LEELLDDMVAGDGLIAGRTDGIAKSIKQLDKQREVVTLRLESIEARYRAQFTSLDNLISSMRSTSEFLTQQLASLPGSAR
jgi:flagellar hook-associated protein 2